MNMTREEAIEVYNGLINEKIKEAFEFFAPELAESEDERIRKKIVAFIKSHVDEFDLSTDCWDMLAYLEKQKEATDFGELMNKLSAKEQQVMFDAWEYNEKIALKKQKEQKPVDKFQEYLNASPAERRKMNMDEILGDNKGHQKTPDALTTDSNKEADTSDCKYKNLDDIAQEYVDGVRQYNPEPTWDLMQTAVCYGYHLAEQKEQKPIPKFEIGDRIVSTKNSRLTYEILEVGHVNELGNIEYKVEIFTDGKSDNPSNVKYMECCRVDEWGKLIEQKPTILEVFGFKVGDAVRLKDGDGRKHIIKSFEEVEGVHGPNFYLVEFEDNSARDGIFPGEDYPNGYYTQMEKFEKEQKPAEIAPNQFEGITYGMQGYSTEKPAEWSEEDKEMIQFYLDFTDYKLGCWPNTKVVEMRKKFRNWLESLPERLQLKPSWKPSREQMDSLRDTIVNTKGYSYSMYLPELYEQLKKLM